MADLSADSEPEGSDATLREAVGLLRMMVRPHFGVFLVSIVGAALFAGTTVLTARVLGWVIDEVVIASFEAGDVATSAWAGAGFIIAIAILRSAGVVTRRYFAGMTSERVERWARDEMAAQYVAQPMSWLRQWPTGRLIAHVDADAMVLVHALHPLPFGFGVLFLIVFAGISLVAIDPWIALVALVLFPLMLIINTGYSRIVKRPMAERQERMGDVTAVAHESFEGVMIVKTLGRGEAELDRFDHAAERLQDRRVHVGFLRAYMDSALHMLPSLGILAVIGVGALRIRAGSMSPGDIVEISALFAALSLPMHVLGFLLQSMIPSVVAWKRLAPVMEAPAPLIPERSGPPLSGPLGVQVESLSFAWPDAPHDLVLDDVNLTIRAGETLAIVGSTGSGKSTLCAAIAGVLDQASPHVTVGDVRLSDWTPEDRTASIAYVLQEAFLFAETIRANIDLDDTAELESITRAATTSAVHEWIESLDHGYDTVVGERGITMSGGQRQRVALARALVRSAGLVILDDATSAVDTVVEQQILSRLRAERDATMVIVANRLATITLADRVVQMVNGQIAAIGTHDELMHDPAYRSLVTAYQQAAGV